MKVRMCLTCLRELPVKLTVRGNLVCSRCNAPVKKRNLIR